MVNDHLANEWAVLQNQFDSYEKYSLLIKLVSILLLSASFFFQALGCDVVILLLVLWLQDAIWKTFQSRIETRLLTLEEQLGRPEQEQAQSAYQFNRDYLKSRPSTVGLIKEYLSQALRPTIAYPHAVLVVFALAILFFD